MSEREAHPDDTTQLTLGLITVVVILAHRRTNVPNRHLHL